MALQTHWTCGRDRPCQASQWPDLHGHGTPQIRKLVLIWGTPAPAAEALLNRSDLCSKPNFGAGQPCPRTGSSRPSPDVHSQLGAWIVEIRHAKALGKQSSGQGLRGIFDQKVRAHDSLNTSSWLEQTGYEKSQNAKDKRKRAWII